MEDTKPFWASKTIWVNIIMAIAMVTSGFGLDLGLDAETQTGLVAGVMAVINIILRFVTVKPIATSSNTP